MMKKNKIGDVKDTRIILPAVLLVSGLLFFLVELTGWCNFLKKSIHWVSDPITVNAEKAGDSVSEYFGVLINIPATQKELNDLRAKLFDYESKLAYTILLEDENNSLRDEINLGNMNHTYIEASILGKVNDNLLRVNAGSNQDVKVGNTVSVGHHFIGIVVETSEGTSTVRLPLSKSSTVEALVSSTTDENKALSRAVVRGSGEEYMIIENISKNANVKEGDYVLINDENVVDTLVLGKISKLDADPASTSVSGEVVPIADYQSLLSVFICTKW